MGLIAGTRWPSRPFLARQCTCLELGLRRRGRGNRAKGVNKGLGKVPYLVELLSKSASDSLEFSDGVSLRVKSDTGLSATKWNVASGALPGHESSKSLDLVHVDVGGVSHTTLGWETVVRVLSSVAGENLV